MEHRSLNRALEILLARLSRYSEAVFCGGELAEWPDTVTAALMQSGLFREHTNADCVPCPGCEERCWVTPEWRTLPNGQQVLLGFCEERADVGLVEFEPDHLRQWRADLETVGALFREQLPLGGTAETVVHGQLYLAGHRRVGGKLTQFYVAGGLGPKSESILEQNITAQAAVILTPTRLPDQGWGARRAVRPVALKDVIFEEDGQIRLDLDSVLGGQPDPVPSARTVSPVDLPPGCTWEQVYLTFVAQGTVEIKAGRLLERRTFETLGMSDSRRRPAEPDQQWALLRLLAEHEGSLGWNDRGASDNLRATMARLRRQLRQVFAIEDDPIKEYRPRRRWETQFRVRSS